MRRLLVPLLAALAALAVTLDGATAPAARASCSDPAGTRCGVLGSFTSYGDPTLVFRPAAGGATYVRDARGGDTLAVDGRRLWDMDADGQSGTITTFPTAAAAWAQFALSPGIRRDQAEAALAAGAPADQPAWVDVAQRLPSFEVTYEVVVRSVRSLVRRVGGCLLAATGSSFDRVPFSYGMLTDDVYRQPLPVPGGTHGRRTSLAYIGHPQSVQLLVSSATRRSSNGRNILAGLHRFYHHSIVVNGRRWYTVGSQAVHAGRHRITQVARLEGRHPTRWATLLAELRPVCPTG